MSEYTNSGFAFYSLGTVAANKKRKSFEIEVTPHEAFPMLDGEVTDNTVDFEAKGSGEDGENSYDHKLKTTASIVATWLPFTCVNRKTAPDVRRGETVMIWRYKETDKFYWSEMLDSKGIHRRLETVTWAFSNEKEENKELTHENTYWMEVSTHDKYIHLRTTKSDGEPYQYDIQLNTKEGFLMIKDDDGNHIFLDSKNRHIQMLNKDKSMIELDKRIINIESQDEINLKTKKYTLNASQSIDEKTKTHTYQSTSYSLKFSSYTMKGSKYSNTTTSITNTGTITHNGNVTVSGNHTTVGTSFEGSSSGPNNTW